MCLSILEKLGERGRQEGDDGENTELVRSSLLFTNRTPVKTCSRYCHYNYYFRFKSLLDAN